MKNEAIRYLVSFTVLLLVTLNLAVACAQPAPSPPSPIPPRAQPPTVTENQTSEEAPPVNEAINEKEWYTIGTFSGKGNDTIPPFHIYGTEWHIVWTIDAEYPETAALDLFIHFHNESGSIWKTVTFTDGGNGDITYPVDPGGNRDFFIKVIVQNLRYWAITLEDNAPAAASSPVQITYIHYKGKVYPTDPKCCCYGYEKVEPDEYVVIKNLSETSVKMGGWVLKNITKGYPSFTFPLNFIFGPGQIIRVYTDEIYPECGTWLEFGTDSKAPYCENPGKIWFSFNWGAGDIWSNEKPDVAVLYDAQGNEVSRKSYAVPIEMNETNSE
jgi:hypothetical protein